MSSSHQSISTEQNLDQDMSYEKAFAELEAIVAALEADKHTLDETMRLYERGQILARHCSHLLEQAELKVMQLSGEELVDFNSSP
jgi:exodeoxyribonuclease VII small subunit